MCSAVDFALSATALGDMCDLGGNTVGATDEALKDVARLLPSFDESARMLEAVAASISSRGIVP